MYMNISTTAPYFHMFKQFTAWHWSNVWKASAPVPWNAISKKNLPHCIVVHLGAMAIRVDIRERRRRDLECKVMLASVLAENPKEFHRHHRVFINNPNQSCASLASHTVILSDRALGPLQFCLPVFLGKGFIHFYPLGLVLGQSLRHILDKVSKWHFLSTSNKGIWPKKFWFPCMDKKVPFWQFFRMGWDGCALLGRPSRIPQRN